jgi:hypothetical protein
MVTPELADYIAAQRKSAFSDEAILGALVSAGHSPEEARRALSETAPAALPVKRRTTSFFFALAAACLVGVAGAGAWLAVRSHTKTQTKTDTTVVSSVKVTSTLATFFLYFQENSAYDHTIFRKDLAADTPVPLAEYKEEADFDTARISPLHTNMVFLSMGHAQLSLMKLDLATKAITPLQIAPIDNSSGSLHPFIDFSYLPSGDLAVWIIDAKASTSGKSTYSYHQYAMASDTDKVVAEGEMDDFYSLDKVNADGTLRLLAPIVNSGVVRAAYTFDLKAQTFTPSGTQDPTVVVSQEGQLRADPGSTYTSLSDSGSQAQLYLADPDACGEPVYSSDGYDISSITGTLPNTTATVEGHLGTNGLATRIVGFSEQKGLVLYSETALPQAQPDCANLPAKTYHTWQKAAPHTVAKVGSLDALLTDWGLPQQLRVTSPLIVAPNQSAYQIYRNDVLAVSSKLTVGIVKESY